MNQWSCLGNAMFIGNGNSSTAHVLYHLQKTLHFSVSKMHTAFKSCTLSIKPINAPIVASNQASPKSCKKQSLIWREATDFSFLYYE